MTKVFVICNGCYEGFYFNFPRGADVADATCPHCGKKGKVDAVSKTAVFPMHN